MLGLVLEGGGAKGAYHIGALTALYEMGLKFDGVTGTSIGALNGAMLAQDDWRLLNEIWNDIRISTILDIDDAAFENLMHFKINRNLLGYLKDKVKIFGTTLNTSTERMHCFIESYIDEQRIRSSKMDFGLVTYSINKLTPFELMKEDIPEGQMIDYIIASANFPVYKSQRIDGNYFIDGGVYDNVPVGLLSKKGYTDFVCIRTTNRFQQKLEAKYSDYNVKYIVPSEKLGSAMNFTSAKINYSKNLGYYDVKRVYGCIGRRYCISPLTDEQFFSTLLSFPDEIYLEPLFREKIPLSHDKEENVLQLFKFLQCTLGLNENAGLIETFFTFIEPFAEVYGIDRFKEYSVWDFLQAVYQKARFDVFDREGKVIKSKKIKSDAARWAFIDMVKFFPMCFCGQTAMVVA